MRGRSKNHLKSPSPCMVVALSHHCAPKHPSESFCTKTTQQISYLSQQNHECHKDALVAAVLDNLHAAMTLTSRTRQQLITSIVSPTRSSSSSSKPLAMHALPRPLRHRPQLTVHSCPSDEMKFGPWCKQKPVADESRRRCLDHQRRGGAALAQTRPLLWPVGHLTQARLVC